MLDIGGDVGALLLHVDSALLDHEIELVPADPTVPRCHSAVRERHVGTGPLCIAVYPALRSGAYTVEGSGQQVEVEGGRITEVVYAVAGSVSR